MKEPTKELDKNAVSVVCSDSHVKEEVVVHVQQKSPRLYPYFHPDPIAHWTSLQLENTSIMEVNMDWKSLQFLIFMDLKGPLNSSQDKITKIEENLNEIVKHCPKLNLYKRLTRKTWYGLLLGFSSIEWSVLESNVSWDLKMISAIKCPVHRVFVTRVCHKGLL